ncbi:hypothetical protein RHGRI_004062 [Rhododendron griersonianum]|uniref:Rx N-terminal domain-containing protein n=1 Tax=Rhododendron griersonianum TaxID=479676 RepID=A0AAV6L766_9ERIC|nr:hypothetical protein RHGRI_004062 [Rhododendron griersonianum]
MALEAVSSTINTTLVPLLSGEVNLLRNIHIEVASIKAELESIMSFLEDADSSAKLGNGGAKIWVKQARAVAYQIEDVMDEYILHLAENRQRRGFIGFLRKLSHSITKLKPQHDIASKIQDIKQIIHDIKGRADRYGFTSLQHGPSSETEEKVHDDPRVASLFIEEDEVVGVESTREELIHRMLIGESNRTITSLVDQSWNNETRRWSMHMRCIKYKDLETISSTKSRIRSVFLFSVGELPKQQLLGTLAMNFKLLKVLDLQGAPLDQLDGEVGNLLHLRYLSVKRTKVKIIPKSIGNLHNLQTLNLKYSLVDVLQIGILSRLRKLRHLIGSGVKIQGGIGHLEELQTLRNVEANDDLIKELENLRQLRKLGIVINLKREHGKALCTAIEKMNHLQSLAIWAINGDGILDLHCLSSPPESLRDLYLDGHLEMLPNWILRLDNLVSLSLIHSGLTSAHAIKALQTLPNLIKLDFYRGYDGEQLYFDVGGFPKLKFLYLEDLKGLNSVIIEEGGLPVLKELQIICCPQLKKVPFGIRSLKELKSLVFSNMSIEFFERMKPGEGQDYWIIEHIPNVKFLWMDGRGFQNDEPEEVGGVE